MEGRVYWDELVVLVHTNFLAPPSQRVCPTEPQVDGGAIAAEYRSQCCNVIMYFQRRSCIGNASVKIHFLCVCPHNDMLTSLSMWLYFVYSTASGM